MLWALPLAKWKTTCDTGMTSSRHGLKHGSRQANHPNWLNPLVMKCAIFVGHAELSRTRIPCVCTTIIMKDVLCKAARYYTAITDNNYALPTKKKLAGQQPQQQKTHVVPYKINENGLDTCSPCFKMVVNLYGVV